KRKKSGKTKKRKKTRNSTPGRNNIQKVDGQKRLKRKVSTIGRANGLSLGDIGTSMDRSSEELLMSPSTRQKEEGRGNVLAQSTSPAQRKRKENGSESSISHSETESDVGCASEPSLDQRVAEIMAREN